MPNAVINSLHQRPLFEGYVVCGLAPRADTKEVEKGIGLHARNTISIPGSILNTIGLGTYTTMQ